MKHRRDPIAAAVRYALCATAAVALVTPVLAQAQEDEQAAELERVEVTGSRIKRTDIEGALPVTVIDREEIELSGYSSAADFIRQLPFNSFGSFRPQSGSSAQGDAMINLRGLGSDRTLVLVNGRRLAKSPTTGSTQNLNTIPLGAVERIEILSDGASAIYGSDAIGGVINVVLRKDFQGAEMMLGGGEPNIPKEGGQTREGYVTFGTGTATTNIIAGASWNQRDIIFARDFPWYTPGGSVYSNNYTTVEGGFDQFNWTEIPGGCEADTGNTTGSFYEIASSGALTGTRCGYNFALVSADEASYDTESAYIRAEHEFMPNWSVFSDVWYTKTSSFGRYAPVPDTSYFYDLGNGPGGGIDLDSPNNPTNPNGNVYDPTFGSNINVNIWHRFDALGNRDNEVENTLSDLLVGAKGMIGGVELEAGWRNTNNKTFDIGRNYLLADTAFRLINDGSYDLQNPTGTDQATLNSMKVTISRISTYNQWEAYASAGFDLFETPAGPVQWFFGGEYREEDYNDQYDSLSEAGVVGGSSGNSAGGTRDVTAFYGEALIPVIDSLEVSLAGRYDDYSDYGSDFSPKISGRWQPLESLTFRASYGEGFRAPTLDILTQKDSFSADTVNDPTTCTNAGQPANCDFQINGLRTANPNLGSEKSKQYSVGFAYAPFSWLNGTLDYWNTKITDRINFFSAQELVDRELAGDPIPSGLGVERSPNGTITRVVQGYGNEGEVKTDGIDLNVKTNFDLFGGSLSNNLIVSYTIGYNVDGGRDLVGDPGAPQYRAALLNTYAWRDFSFSWNMNAIDSTADFVEDGKRMGHVPAWITHDLQANYFTPWDGRITIGALNVGDKSPPIGVGDTAQRDYDFNLYSGMGRITYVRYTQSF